MSKTVWRHLALLSMLAFVLWARTSQFHRTAPQLGWGEAVYAGAIHTLDSGQLGWFLAVAAGIAVGTSTVGRRGVRTAVAVLAMTMLAMVALDVVVEPAATRAAKSAAKLAAASVTTAWPGFFNDTTIRSRADTLGNIRTGIQLLRERPAALHEPLGESWSQDNPRSLAVEAAMYAPTLLLPFIGIGIMLGAGTWVRNRVTFRAPRDETVARWVSAWVLVPAVCGFIAAWSSGSNYMTLHTRDYWLPLHPYLPFLVIAALGWRAAVRDHGAQSAASP
jgi:hypothetical protein